MTTNSNLTFHEIQSQLSEIEVNLNSHQGDEQYDLSDLIAEKEELEDLLSEGNYVDGEEI